MMRSSLTASSAMALISISSVSMISGSRIEALAWHILHSPRIAARLMAAIPLKSWYFYNIVRGIAEAPAIEKTRGAAIGIVAAVSLSHLLNDILQSLIPAVYPILKTTYRSE